MSTDALWTQVDLDGIRRTAERCNALVREALAGVQIFPGQSPETLDSQRVSRWLDELLEDLHQVARDLSGSRRPQSEAWQALMQALRERRH